MIERLAVRRDFGAQRHIAARGKDGRTVITKHAVDDGNITGLHGFGQQVAARRDHADAGCGDKNSIA